MRTVPFVLALAISTPALATLRPVNLRCEHLVRPMGVDTPSPRLSWNVESADRGARQSAYRILVAENLAVLKTGNGDLCPRGLRWRAWRARSYNLKVKWRELANERRNTIPDAVTISGG